MQLPYMAQDLTLVVDNLVSVEYRQSGGPTVSLNNCVLQTPTTWKELHPTGGNVLRHGTRFIWPKALSPAPTLGSIIVDSNNYWWTVWKAIAKEWVQSWEPLCLNLNIVDAPWNRALLLEAVYGKGQANEAKAQWRGLYSHQVPPAEEDTVRARFQPADETAKIQFGSEWTRADYKVYLEKPIKTLELAGGEYRIVSPDGARFRVNRYFQEQTFADLPVALCSKVTEGMEFWQSPHKGP